MSSGRAVITSSVLAALAFILVGLRLVSRITLVKQAHIDDMLIIAAVVFSIVLTGLIIAQAQHGLGRHFNDLQPGEFERMMKPFWASVVVYNLGLSLTKDSVLFQFLRFFVTRESRRATWTLVVLVSSYGLAILVVTICSCTPVSYFWDRSLVGGKCIDLLAFWYTNATFNIITDIAVVVLPIHVLKELHLPRKQKWALTLIFALGGFSCVTSILRLHSIYVVANSKDVTWDNVDAAMWSAIELNTAIICACLPALKPIVMKFAPRWLTQSTAYNNNSLDQNPQSSRSDRKMIHAIEVNAIEQESPAHTNRA